jgi:hypothetical protein
VAACVVAATAPAASAVAGAALAAAAVAPADVAEGGQASWWWGGRGEEDRDRLFFFFLRALGCICSWSSVGGLSTSMGTPGVLLDATAGGLAAERSVATTWRHVCCAGGELAVFWGTGLLAAAVAPGRL